LPRRNFGRSPLPEPTIRDNNNLYRRNGGLGDDTSPFISNPRQPRPDDVNASASLPQYNRPNEREYPVATRKKSGPGQSGDVEYYVGHSPEHEQPLPYVSNISLPCPFFLSGPVVAWLTCFILICALKSSCLTINFCVFVNSDLMPLHLRFAYSMLVKFSI
jgi:hypothetical protein